MIKIFFGKNFELILALSIMIAVYIVADACVYIFLKIKNPEMKKFREEIQIWVYKMYGIELTARQIRILGTPWPMTGTLPIFNWPGSTLQSINSGGIFDKNTNYNYLSCGIELPVNDDNVFHIGAKKRSIFLTISNKIPKLLVVNRFKRTGQVLQILNH